MEDSEGFCSGPLGEQNSKKWDQLEGRFQVIVCPDLLSRTFSKLNDKVKRRGEGRCWKRRRLEKCFMEGRERKRERKENLGEREGDEVVRKERRE